MTLSKSKAKAKAKHAAMPSEGYNSPPTSSELEPHDLDMFLTAEEKEKLMMVLHDPRSAHNIPMRLDTAYEAIPDSSEAQ